MSLTGETTQLQIEAQSVTEGSIRYLRQQKRLEEDQGYSSRSDASKIIKGCLPQVAKVIESYLSTTNSGGKGKTQAGFAFLKELAPEQLALIALSCVFNSIPKQQTVSQVCYQAGKLVENELWALGLSDKDGQLFTRLVERAMRTHGNVAYRKKALRSTALKEDYRPDPFSNDMRVKIGTPLINAVLIGCEEIFRLYNSRNEKGTDKHLGLTTEGRELLESITDLEAWMTPVFKPMIVPPKPWTAFDSGCYLSEAVSRNVPLVRTPSREHRTLIKDAIKAGLMQGCLESLNAIQDTAWRINTKMLEVVKWAWETGVVLDSFPQRVHLKKPARPENWEDLADTAKKAWRIRASKIAERNRGIDGERVVVLQDFAVADEMAKYNQWYVPHSLDFRGRVYPVPHFNQQRADHIKSLMEFAEGVPLGDEGAYWLSVHLANCADFDKLSKRPFEERVQWVVDNEAMIKQVAADPIGTFDTWSKADKPFQFVAACLDYAKFLEVGYEYVSHLAVALDGSNSGLQHYSAALRSPEGALVCLTPSEQPADVYQAVCDRAKAIVEVDAAKGDEVAQVVLENGVSRGLVKRNVMTFAYSSELFGFAQQQREDLMNPLTLKVLEGQLVEHPYGLDNGFKASMYIAKVVWRAVNEIVKDASNGMKFFQKCAQALAHERKGLVWYTPVGLPVLHKYTDWDCVRVRLFLYDKSVPVTAAKPQDKVIGDHVLKGVRANIRTKPNEHINKAKAKSAVAPNVIHSLDGSHLLLTVLASKYKGIRSYSLIHDSFGTHAGKTSEFFYTIRETFVDMYEDYDPFEEIAYHTTKALEDKSKAPELPQRGDLDLSQVINSLYAFA